MAPQCTATGDGDLCAACGLTFTTQEWDERHSSATQEYHDRCCPVCHLEDNLLAWVQALRRLGPRWLLAQYVERRQ
jgi:RNA polymerase subunit RPABC4/transcription elongation factor Spt4